MAVGLALFATSAGANELFLTRSAVSGVNSTIAHERAWDRACAGRTAVVTIVRPPSHGTLVVEQDVSVIPDSTPRFGSTKQCAGRSVNGNKLVYRSQQGFHGDDQASWDVAYDGAPKVRNTVTIKVK
jgi:hypothetical protein